MKGISLLPGELVLEILLWLPVKSLLRFRSVCKKWQSLIDDDRQFVAEHHKRSKEYLLVKTFDEVQKKATVSLLCRRTRSVVIPKIDTSDFDSIGGRVSDYYHLSGPCNGVFCVQISLGLGKLQGCVLWNPATRKTRTIPEPTIDKYPSDQNIQHVVRSRWFGFDAKSNDYKVVHLRVAHHRHSNQSVVYAQVYRLSCNSWQEIGVPTAPPQQSLHKVTPTNISIDNGIFVLLAENTDARLVILSFDFSDETTTTTLLPSDYNKLSPVNNEGYNMSYLAKDGGNLFVLDGCIALVNHLKQQPDHYEIWVLNEIGNEESWTKLYKFGPCSDLNLPLGNVKQHELFAESASGESIWCCPGDPPFTVLEWRLCTRRGSRAILWAINYEYKESLVRID